MNQVTLQAERAGDPGSKPDRQEITLEELARRKQAGLSMANVQITGMVHIIDKDGNVKAELPIERID